MERNSGRQFDPPHNLIMLAQAEIVRKAMELLGSGKLQLHIDSTFSLSEIAATHRRLESGGMMDKVVLRNAD
jgi:NADPH:quinone reductase-like Zn-dependent oxidoreductase